ncbi:MAG: hypothetical protein VX466_01530 [Myxococcota bacterium]|nr:hypothetical protein [Myxococcota bacterium]
MRGCETPLLVLMGDDLYHPQVTSREVADLAPNAELVERWNDDAGLVNASSDAGFTAQQSMDYAVEELKNQAAKIGANGILLQGTGLDTSTTVGGYGTGYVYSVASSTHTISGIAIYITE